MATRSPDRRIRPRRGKGSAFGRLVRRHRRLRGFSALDLALECGVTEQTVRFWETGASVPVRFEQWAGISALLGLPLSALWAAYSEALPDPPRVAPECACKPGAQ